MEVVYAELLLRHGRTENPITLWLTLCAIWSGSGTLGLGIALPHTLSDDTSTSQLHLSEVTSKLISSLFPDGEGEPALPVHDLPVQKQRWAD